MKSKLKTALYLALCASVGASGFYLGRTSVKPVADTSQEKAQLVANILARRQSAQQLAGGNASVQEFLHSAGRPDAARLAEWAKSLSPSDSAAYMAELQKLAPGLQRDSVMNAIIGSWAEKDPQGFLASSKDITGPQMRENGTENALESWAKQNPQEALKWLKDNPGSASPSALRDRYVAAISGFAAADPEGAFATVTAMGDGNLADQRLKNQAMNAVMNSLSDAGKFTDANTLIATLPDGSPLKEQAYSNLARDWARANPQDASAWVSTLTDPQLKANLSGQIASRWAATDPAAAAKWAAEMDSQSGTGGIGNGNNNDYALADAMRTWAAYDLNAPAEFLNQMPASPGKDDAVATYALYAAQEDPAGAMNWVNTIGDSQMRQRLAMVTALQWSQTDPNGYQEFMSSSNTLTNQQKQLLNRIPPAVGQMLSGGFGGGRGGVPGNVQNFIINGAAGNGGNGGFNGGFNNLLQRFGRTIPAGQNQTAPTYTAPTPPTDGPRVILSQPGTQPGNRRGRNFNGGGG